jgi:hypothetical protein
MSYTLYCGDKSLIIKDFQKEQSYWQEAMKIYLKKEIIDKPEKNKNEYTIATNIYELLEEFQIFDNGFSGGLNAALKIIFDRAYIDEFRSRLNYEITNEIKESYRHLNLNGYVIWMNKFINTSNSLNSEEIQQIILTLQLLSPYFQTYDVFAKYDKKWRRDPFIIDIEKEYQSFYLYPIFKKSLDENTDITIKANLI